MCVCQCSPGGGGESRSLGYVKRGLSLKRGTGNRGTGNEERGTGTLLKGESLKWEIAKRGI